MPKARQKSSRPLEDSDEEVQPTQSQVTMTQAQRSLASVSEEDKRRRVNDLVQYLLLMDQKKVPIKRQDINKNVLKEMSRAFPIMMQKAEEVLNQTFGYKLVEIEGKQKSYIILNTLETDSENMHLEWSEEDNCKMGVVMVVLSVIFMSGSDTLAEGVMWRALEKLGLHRDVRHEVFGDIKKFVTTDLVRQCYLEYIRLPNSDPPAFEFKWGSRAKAEISKRKVLDFVSQIYGMEPESFRGQYQQIVDEESNGQENGA